MINKGMMTSNTDQWATPQSFFDELNKEFGFTLDVCADKNNAKCAKYYTKEQDGIEQKWEGVCWMNPPYGREILQWCAKAYASGCLVVGLLPSRTDTRWFHNYIYGKAEIRFIRGRLKFGDAKNSAPFPSMVVIWRSK